MKGVTMVRLSASFMFFLLIFTIIGCGGGGGDGTTVKTVATPTFSPVGGTYQTDQSVVISSSTPGTSIYYTVDGSTPTVSSTLYTSPLTVFRKVTPTTIKAIGVLGGLNNSAVATEVYFVMNYPYQTVDGISCAGYEVMPGCTFNIDRTRVTVSHDPFYNRFGGGSNDLWSIKFDSFGTSYVYDDFGTFQYTAAISSYSGWVSGNTIGVGTSGLYWENVAGGTYWLGKNSVLYSGNTLSAKYGQAIN